jgi:hypothetical protein
VPRPHVHAARTTDKFLIVRQAKSKIFTGCLVFCCRIERQSRLGISWAVLSPNRNIANRHALFAMTRFSEGTPMLRNNTAEQYREPSSEWSLVERRAILRELIVHEDNLTISRSQSLYTIQGFLFASLGLLTKDSPLPPWALRSVIVLVALVGISAAASYFLELKKNTWAIGSIVGEWRRLTEAAPDAPRIIGYLKKKSSFSPEVQYESPLRLPRGMMPVVFIAVWILMPIILLLSPTA